MSQVEAGDQQATDQQMVEAAETAPMQADPDVKAVVHIAFDDLTFAIKQHTAKDMKTRKKKTIPERIILNHVSGICKGGEVTAILGSSGAGKTSLLNIISKRVKANKLVSLTGRLVANDVEYTGEIFHTFANYVMQDDVLIETMTVKECLSFAGNIRLSGTKEERAKVVSDMLTTLRLEKCQNAYIGGQTFKGISGGERKRVSIGFELITSPAAFFLDEPTSGLDSFTAFLVINMLKNYAKKRNAAVIFTIHQPSSDIWFMFDRIMLLVEGKFIYQGAGRDTIIKYFNDMGFPCPRASNPADYYISIMHNNKVNSANFPTYFETYETQQAPQVAKEIEERPLTDLPVHKKAHGMCHEMLLLCERSFWGLIRNPMMVNSRISQTIFIAIFIGIIYWQLGNQGSTPETEMRNRAGVLFFMGISGFMQSMSPVMLSFPLERPVFLREQNSKLYKPFSYYIGKTTPELLFQIIFPLITTIISYPMIGLNYSPFSRVPIFYLVLYLNYMVASSFGYLAGAIFYDPKVAMGVMPLFLMPFMLFGGFYKSAEDYAAWIAWFQYLSPFFYTFQALGINEFEGSDLEKAIDVYSLHFGLWESVGVLIGYFLAIRILVYVVLKLLVKSAQ